MNFSGNRFLGGARPFESISHDRGACPGSAPRVVLDPVVDIADAHRSVTTASGQRFGFDRLVVAPGIGFRTDAIDGYDADAASAMPHAYSGGDSLRALRARLEAMPDGGTVLIAPPAGSQRCPPAPYERASLLAAYLRAEKPRSKILIVDAKDAFPLQEPFLRAWDRHYPEMIEWLPAELTGGVRGVDAGAMTVSTEDEVIEAAVVNLIPPQRAGDLAVVAGLAGDDGWCPVDLRSLESKRVPGVHVIGDAAGIPGLPKSAFVAESQALVCAGAVRQALLGAEPPPVGFENRCYSRITADQALRLGARYEPAGAGVEGRDGYETGDDADDAERQAAAVEAGAWERAFVRRMTC